MSSLNDISWYAHNPALLAASASIPFPYRPGMQMKMGQTWKYSNDKWNTNSVVTEIPGILSIKWVPSIGFANTTSDPINVAAREIYGKVRDVYSGTLHADAPDFIIYLVALDSIFSAIGSLKRIYRVLNAYSADNYVVPDGLLMAMGIPITAISVWRKARMELFGYINELCAKASRFVCPSMMDYFNRHYWLNDNVYTDAPVANSQLYVFQQEWYYKFALVDDPQSISVGGCVPTMISLMSPSAAYSAITDLLDALGSSEDAYTISGYLMRAFPDYGQFVVEPLSIDERFTPVYVEEVLSQIENSSSLPQGAVVKATTFTITQDPSTNSVISAPTVDISATTNVLMDTGGVVSLRGVTDAVSVTIATRLHTVLEKLYDGMDLTRVRVFSGSEIVTKYQLGYYISNPDGSRQWRTSDIYSYCALASTASGNVTSYSTFVSEYTMLTNFDWSPLMYVFDTATTSSRFVRVFGDIHNVTPIERDQLNLINRVCLYSEFNAFNIY